VLSVLSHVIVLMETTAAMSMESVVVAVVHTDGAVLHARDVSMTASLMYFAGSR